MKELFSRASEPARRSFLQGVAATSLGVSLPTIHVCEAQAAARESGTPKATADSVIYIFLSGGLSHSDTFDIKTHPDTSVGFKSIKTNAKGVMIGETLPSMARLMDKVTLVRSISSKIGDHSKARYFMRTNYEKRSTIAHPTMGAWTSKFRPGENESLPSYVKVGSGSGRGFLDSVHGALPILSPENGLRNSVKHKSVSHQRFDDRLNMLQRMNESFNVKYKKDAIQANTNAYEGALNLMRSKDLAAFDIKKEDKKTLEAYGNTPFGKACLLARRLVENGTRVVDVNSGEWDHHFNIKEKLPPKMSELDKVLSTLIEDLDSRGLLERTMVVVATEFGRKPRIATGAGRSHHPLAFTCLMAGGGAQGGYVHGKTDDKGHAVVRGKVAPADFNATIATALGLNVNQVIMAPNGRPFQIAHKGKPIAGVLS